MNRFNVKQLNICIVTKIRGSFKKFCYERLTVRRKKLCFTDFMYTYSSSFIRNPHVKFQNHQANTNIAIDIQSSINHIHWPIFEDEKEERVEIGGVNFYKKSGCVKTLVPNKTVEQSYEYNK